MIQLRGMNLNIINSILQHLHDTKTKQIFEYIDIFVD